jgi:hypothetical protein
MRVASSLIELFPSDSKGGLNFPLASFFLAHIRLGCIERKRQLRTIRSAGLKNQIRYNNTMTMKNPVV